jgi:predicted P-loop ATPase
MTDIHTPSPHFNVMRFRPMAEEDRRRLPPKEEWGPGKVIKLDRRESRAQALEPDCEDAERFLTALDPDASQFTFQTFDDDADRKDKALAQIMHGSLDRRWDALCRLNERGAGVFVTVNETDGKGRKQENITRVRACFVDLDGAPLPETFHAKAHTIVESSPGRWHLYWLVEGCSLGEFKALQKRLSRAYGGDPAVHDLPRVMRLPGFMHRKAELFRSRLVEAHDHPAYSVEDLTAGLPEEEKAKPKANDKGPNGRLNVGRKLQDMAPGNVNDTLLRVSAALLNRGTPKDQVVEVLLARAMEVNPSWDRERQRAELNKMCDRWLDGQPQWRGRHKDGSPTSSMHNAQLAITAIDVECSYDTFHNKLLVGYRSEALHELQHILGEITDHTVIALREILGDRFGTDFGDKHTRDAVTALANKRRFDPVCDMLDQAQAAWDGTERLDNMAVDYANCADTPLNRAIMRKTMIAAVRRARRPGCKFDNITVLESEEGWNKSTFWRVLAGDENFSDESILGKSGREIQEHLSEVWIHESADLAGMRKAEVESVKAFASRQVDIARPAYGYFVKKQKRHTINVGTTNSDEYLQSQTGNRRFWPLKVLKRIDIEKLERSRLQLWGEAATYEAKGEPITIPQELWGAAAAEQEKRRVKDPWEDVLADMPQSVEVYERGSHLAGTIKITHDLGDKEFISSADVLTHVLKLPTDRQDRHHAMRLADAMKRLGWARMRATVGGRECRGFARLANDAILPGLGLVSNK